MYGLRFDRLMYTRSFLTLVYATMVGIQYIMHLLKLKIICGRIFSMCGNARRSSRKYVAKMRYRVYIVLIAAYLLLLLLCGDVHPNPGPIFPGSSRHPNLQHLVVGAWNVRTLLETKRTHVRPSAIIARELDRYGVDIAALSETRILGESMFEEKGGGYTFFLKGKPVGDKH